MYFKVSKSCSGWICFLLLFCLVEVGQSTDRLLEEGVEGEIFKVKSYYNSKISTSVEGRNSEFVAGGAHLQLQPLPILMQSGHHAALGWPPWQAATSQAARGCGKEQKG